MTSPPDPPPFDAKHRDAAVHADALTPDAPLSRSPARRRCWPVMTSIAATLMLASGLAWQLRPVDQLQSDVSEASRPGVSAAARSGGLQAQVDAVAATDRSAIASSPPPRSPMPDTAAPSEDPPVEPTSVATGADTAVSEAMQHKPAQVTVPPPEAPPIVLDAPLPIVDTPAPMPPASMPQVFSPPPSATQTVAAGRAIDEPHTSAAAAAAAETNPAIATERKASSTEAGSLDRSGVSGSPIDGFSDQPLDDQPPASFDLPQVREAWLSRTRQLLADGRDAAARDSLREYARRYPDAAIPDDLRPLLK
ncbi:MAG: hypothetical protein ACREO8_14065 [Luteimonas sp.]